MKRLSALLLAVLLLLTACQNDTNSPSQEDPAPEQDITTPLPPEDSGEEEDPQPEISTPAEEETPAPQEPEKQDTPVQPSTPLVSDDGHKLVALTFDDGPGPYTERLLDILARRNVKVTFFCLGSRAKQYPKLIRRAYDEGHQIASHTYSHYELTKITAEEIINEVKTTAAALDKAIGCSNNYLIRPPYGSNNDTVKQNLGAAGINWSVDPRDWATNDAQEVVNNVVGSAFDGAVILLHDIQSHTVDAVDQIIESLQAQGYELVTVNELFRRRGIPLEAGRIYNQAKPQGNDLEALAAPEITFTQTEEGLVAVLTAQEGIAIYYTADGSLPSGNAQLYTDPIPVEEGTLIRAYAAADKNGGRSPEASATAVAPILPEEPEEELPLDPEEPSVDPGLPPEELEKPEDPALPAEPDVLPEEDSSGEEA